MSLQTRRNTLRDKQRTPLTYRHQSCKPQEDTLCKSHLTVLLHQWSMSRQHIAGMPGWSRPR